MGSGGSRLTCVGRLDLDSIGCIGEIMADRFFVKLGYFFGSIFLSVLYEFTNKIKKLSKKYDIIKILQVFLNFSLIFYR